MARRSSNKTIDDYVRKGKPEKLIAMGGAYLVMAVVIVFILIMTVTAMVRGRKEYREFMKTAVRTDAKCTNVWSKTETYTVHSKHGTRTRHRTVYYANVEYDYNGTTYHLNNVGVSSSHRIGSYVTIYISPDNPLEYRKKTTEIQYKSGLYLITIPFSIVVIVLVYSSIKAFGKVDKAKEVREQMRNNVYLRNESDQNGYNLNGTYYNNFNQNSYNQNSYNQNGTYQNNYNPYGGQNGYHSNDNYSGYDTAGSGQKKDIDDFKSFDSAAIGGNDDEW